MLHRFFIWTDSLELSAQHKYTAAIWLLAGILGCIGGAVWLLIHNFFLDDFEWLVCFVGYPAFSAVFIVFGFSCKNRFHDGKRG